MNETGNAMDCHEALIRRFGKRRVWAVVSTDALDSFYRGLTYPEARHSAQQQVVEPGRSAAAVLEIAYKAGSSL